MESIGILPGFGGILVHDHLKAYLRYADCLHSLCNAHHLRELTCLVEQGQSEWANEMVRLLVVANRCVDRAKQRGDCALSLKLQQLLSQRYDVLVGVGLEQEATRQAQGPELPAPAPKKRGRAKQSKAKNLLDRLSGYKGETLRFIDDFRVPFDNNQAERDIRMVKLKQKISGTFRSQQGAQAFFRIRSYLSSARKQGNNMLTALASCFQGQPVALLGAE